MSLTLTLERGGGEVSGSGTNIELDGTIAGGAIESVEMYGDTEQQTYTGKNLIGLVDGTYTKNSVVAVVKDGVITFSGTSDATGDMYIPYIKTPLTLAAGTYTHSYSRTPSGRFPMNAGLGYSFNIGWNGLPYTTTINSETSYGNSYRIQIAENNNYNGVVIKPQLEIGSTATSFEPYVGGTASPNPDYPQEVQTVTGRQVVTITDGGSESQEYEVNLGKNLFDIDQYTNAVTRGSALVSLTKTSDTTLRTTNLYASTNNYCAIPIPDASRLLGHTITMSFSVSLTNVTAAKAAIFWKTTTNTVGTQIGDMLSITTGGAKTLTFSVPDTFPSGTNGIFCAIYGSDSAQPADSYVDWNNIQIEKGSTATTYAPYFTPIELCKIGTYQDYIYKSGNDWYVKKYVGKIVFNGTEPWERNVYAGKYYFTRYTSIVGQQFGWSNYFGILTAGGPLTTNVNVIRTGQDRIDLIMDGSELSLDDFKNWLSSHNTSYYYFLATPTDTQITNEDLIAQLNALNAGDTYDGTTLITVSSENLAGSLDVTVSSNITKTYTEVEIGSPFTIADVEGKSSNTTLDGNVYVDWAYNKKQYSFDLFNLTPQDYADIRAFYDYQFNNSAFPTITVPELDINKLPVYMEISSRNIINQCLLTDKLTIKFRETVQP